MSETSLEEEAPGDTGGVRRAAVDGLLVTGVWLLFAGSLEVAEVTIAVVVGIAAAIGGVLLRRVTGHRGAPWGGAWTRLPGAMLGALRDCGTLGRVLGRQLRGHPVGGRLRWVSYRIGDVDGPDDIGRRAATTYLTTLQPATYVIGFDHDGGRVLLHELDPDEDVPIADELRS